MVTSLGRGRAWRCRRRSTLCFCAGRALSTGARIGDGAAIPVAADVGRAPSPKVTPLPRERRDRRARQPFEEKRRAELTAQARRPPHCHATRSHRRAPLPSAPGSTSRRPQRRLAPKRGRRFPGLPRCPSPRTRPSTMPRPSSCRLRLVTTSFDRPKGWLRSKCSRRRCVPTDVGAHQGGVSPSRGKGHLRGLPPRIKTGHASRIFVPTRIESMLY